MSVKFRVSDLPSTVCRPRVVQTQSTPPNGITIRVARSAIRDSATSSGHRNHLSVGFRALDPPSTVYQPQVAYTQSAMPKLNQGGKPGIAPYPNSTEVEIRAFPTMPHGTKRSRIYSGQKLTHAHPSTRTDTQISRASLQMQSSVKSAPHCISDRKSAQSRCKDQSSLLSVASVVKIFKLDSHRWMSVKFRECASLGI